MATWATVTSEQSDSRPDKRYEIAVNTETGTDARCGGPKAECPSWRFSGATRWCKHLERASRRYAVLEPARRKALAVKKGLAKVETQMEQEMDRVGKTREFARAMRAYRRQQKWTA